MNRISKVWGVLSLVSYIGTIVAANAALARWGLIPVGFGLMAPAGVFFAGLALVLRDAVHEVLGRWWVIAAIIVGALVSVLVSRQYAAASGAAFLLSEAADFAVYSPLRERHRIWAMLVSNSVGDVVDSAVFLLLAFGSLDFLAGQLVGKAYACYLPVIIYAGIRWQVRRERVALA